MNIDDLKDLKVGTYVIVGNLRIGTVEYIDPKIKPYVWISMGENEVCPPLENIEILDKDIPIHDNCYAKFLREFATIRKGTTGKVICVAKTADDKYVAFMRVKNSVKFLPTQYLGIKNCDPIVVIPVEILEVSKREEEC